MSVRTWVLKKVLALKPYVNPTVNISQNIYLNHLKQRQSHPLPAHSLSRQCSPKPTVFRKILEKISPLSNSSNIKFILKQSHREKSKILTSTPYKVQRKKKKEE